MTLSLQLFDILDPSGGGGGGEEGGEADVTGPFCTLSLGLGGF